MLGINGAELVVLRLIAAVVIGPERLPTHADQLARWVRGLRSTGASTWACPQVYVSPLTISSRAARCVRKADRPCLVSARMVCGVRPTKSLRTRR